VQTAKVSPTHRSFLFHDGGRGCHLPNFSMFSTLCAVTVVNADSEPG
jgi:hypothetical protein